MNIKPILAILFLLAGINVHAQLAPQRNWVDSEVKYPANQGNSLSITNSLPKGGAVVDKNGKKIGYRVFWTRIRNHSLTPIHLKVSFKEVRFLKSKESPMKLVLPKDPMREEKIPLFDYGLTRLQSLFEDTSQTLSITQKKIGPKEDYYFYVSVFLQDKGAARAAFIVKGKDLFYQFTMGDETALIRCGSLEFKN